MIHILRDIINSGVENINEIMHTHVTMKLPSPRCTSLGSQDAVSTGEHCSVLESLNQAPTEQDLKDEKKVRKQRWKERMYLA